MRNVTKFLIREKLKKKISIDNKNCPKCKKPTNYFGFPTEEYYVEALETGLCCFCQDKAYGSLLASRLRPIEYWIPTKEYIGPARNPLFYLNWFEASDLEIK
jgi:hypothetical protein